MLLYLWTEPYSSREECAVWSNQPGLNQWKLLSYCRIQSVVVHRVSNSSLTLCCSRVTCNIRMKQQKNRWGPSLNKSVSSCASLKNPGGKIWQKFPTFTTSPCPALVPLKLPDMNFRGADLSRLYCSCTIPLWWFKKLSVFWKSLINQTRMRLLGNVAISAQSEHNEFSDFWLTSCTGSQCEYSQ